MPADAVSAPPKRQRAGTRDRPAYPRKRAAKACCTCRKRRTKCDNEQPACTSCVDLGIECFYDENDKSTFDAASLAILHRLDNLEELIRTNNPDAQRTQGMQQGIDRPSPLTALKNLGSPALERTEAAVRYYINIETVLSWHVFHDQNLDQRLDLKYLLQSENSHPEPAPLSIPPDFETNGAGQLLENFFENVHIHNPVLEVAKVKQYLRDSQFNGLGLNAQSCLLLLVYALGSISVGHENVLSESSSAFRKSEESRKADAFFFAAQKQMGILLCKSGVKEAQCFFLAGVYLMATLRPIEAWRMFVQALACCQGFHTQGTSEEHHLQQSIYWTCFKSELELRLELNVANHSGWDLTYPSFFPSPPNDLKSQGEAAWYFYLAEIALRRLGNRILNYIYQCESSHTSTVDVVDAVLNFEQQATDWQSSLPPVLKLDNSDGAAGSQSGEHAALRFILNGHLLDCYEMMYWPFVVDAIHGRLRNEPESESFTPKGFLLCVQRIEKNESGFYQRHHGTWLMLRSCTRSALVLVAAVRSGLNNLVAAEWQDAVGKVMQMLRYWRDEVKDVPDRLDILEGLMRGVALVPNS